MTAPQSANDLRSRAGRLLYRQLPEEYRYRDPVNGEPDGFGDLEAFLHGFGHVLDQIRETSEQAYADAFAEPADNGRKLQPWLAPYLAELVGAVLLAPDPDRRAVELDRAVGWFKSKGTLGNIDAIADTLSGLETSIAEGWRQTLIAPRLGLPPFTIAPEAQSDAMPVPYGTPDLRLASRAVRTDAISDPVYRTQFGQRTPDGWPSDPLTVYWQPSHRRGVPSFPGSYDDVAARTPDLRTQSLFRTALRAHGPHPKRVRVHIRPPWGLFEPGLRRVVLPAGPNPLDFDLATDMVQEYGPVEILKALGLPLSGPAEMLDKIEIEGDLIIPAKVRLRLHDCLFLGRVHGNSDHPLYLERCAARSLVIEDQGKAPGLYAKDCLVEEIMSPFGFAQLEHSTVLGDTHLQRLWASDCLFEGELIGVSCSAQDSCIRYSRFEAAPDLAECLSDARTTNTTLDANFLARHIEEPDCPWRPPVFGEPGCGVLDLTTPGQIAEGAENNGEMGAGNHLYHCAQLRALHRKLLDFLPLGQEIALIYDAHLDRPAVLETS